MPLDKPVLVGGMLMPEGKGKQVYPVPRVSRADGPATRPARK
ncbi:MAG: hypothetical protein ACE15C_16615 [Phycisphaerae bacterium]